MLARLNDENNAQWFVLLVVPQHEKIAAGALIGRGFKVKHPEIDSMQRVWRSRRQVLQRIRKPMFPGYLFVRFSFLWPARFDWLTSRPITARSRIASAPGVMQFLKLGDDYAVISDQDMHRVDEIERGERELRNAPKFAHRFAVGELVRVNAGPFTGFSAEIRSLDAESRITILLSMLGRATRVQLSSDELEKL